MILVEVDGRGVGVSGGEIDLRLLRLDFMQFEMTFRFI